MEFRDLGNKLRENVNKENIESLVVKVGLSSIAVGTVGLFHGLIGDGDLENSVYDGLVPIVTIGAATAKEYNFTDPMDVGWVNKLASKFTPRSQPYSEGGTEIEAGGSLQIAGVFTGVYSVCYFSGRGLKLLFS